MTFAKLVTLIQAGEIDPATVRVVLDDKRTVFYRDLGDTPGERIEIDEGEDPRELLHAALFALGFCNTEDA